MSTRILIVAALFLVGCQTTPTEFSTLSSPADGRSSDKRGASEQSDETVVKQLPDVPSNPDVSDLAPKQRPGSDTDEAGLWMAVESMEENIKTAGNLVDDRELNEYLRDVTCRVAGPYCSGIRLYVLRVPSFNATMAPNGMMQIWSGMLLRAENEAQLATIIGHEIGHYVRRHSLQRFEDLQNKADFYAFFQLGAAVGGMPELSDLAYYVTVGSIYSFNRDNEREADAIGIRWMASAGYDPSEAPKIWKRLIEEMSATEEGVKGSSFFSTHPHVSERNETLSAFARYMHEREQLRAEVGSETYQEVVGPWRARFLKDEITVKEPDDALALISVLKNGNIPASTLLFYEGEVHRLRNEEGDIEASLKLYEDARREGDPPDEIYRSRGLVLMKLGRMKEAAQSFESYLKVKPDAPDADMIRFTLQKLES